MYPVGCLRAVRILMPVSINGDDDPSSTCWVDDIDLSHWFPFGSRLLRIRSVPSTDFVLTNGYTLAIAEPGVPSPVNRAIQTTLGKTAIGNVIIFRHSARYDMRATNITHSDQQVVKLILEK